MCNRCGQHKVTDELVEYVAVLYTFMPIRMIAAHLEVHRRTIERWLARSRQRVAA